jgi:GDSL-like Lipase/Acylhydrolase family
MQDVPLIAGPVAIRGAAELEPTSDGLRIHRLPAAARAKLPDDFIRMCELQPAGVRLALRTAATRLELDVRALRTVSVNRPPDGSDGPLPEAGRYDLVVDGEVVGSARADAHGVFRLDHATRRAEASEAPVTNVVLAGLPGRSADVEVWLPYQEVTTLVALRADAPVSPSPAVSEPRWVQHGSSISHGANADAPTGAWPVVAARRAGLDLVNLGFSGNAVLDPFTAQAIRDQAADLISLKIGINVVNHDCMRLRAFRPAVEGFLDIVRDGHPATPLMVISPILCPMVEDCPGPTEIDPACPDDAIVFHTLGRPEELAQDKLSLRVIRQVLREVVDRRTAAGDRALAYLDGLELYGPGEWESLPMPDLLHPDGAGQRHIGERFAALLPDLLGSMQAGQRGARVLRANS